MGQTPIEWTDYTFNPVWGCEKISPGCKNCYANTFDNRLGGKHWGPGSARRLFGEKHWAQPLAWNAKAKRDGRIYRVFCASMADWLEDHLDWIEPRARLEELVASTPNLIWLFLTKRPENWRLMPTSWQKSWPVNAMFGFTGEDQQRFRERAEAWHTFADQCRGIRTFVSAEPLLSDLDLVPCLRFETCGGGHRVSSARIDWIICGGESGHGARPMHPDWARGLRDQCSAAGVPFLFKQWGEWKQVEEAFEYYKYGHTVRNNSDFVRQLRRYAKTNGAHELLSADHLKEGLRNTSCIGYGEPALGRVGKKTAGRLLDGREWNELPKYWPANVGLLEPELDPLKVIA